jgi:transmembrane sensor
MGKLAVQSGTEIEKTASGEVSYHSPEKIGQIESVSFNTITTPRGGQYLITLPDGTKAWLNAASSLSYPVNFQTKERRVKMTGEVYFEVAKRLLPGGQRIPFFVETDKQQIQVLGTHFNVSAYGDDPAVKTTLLEGSVKITSRNKETALLRPGQMASLTEHIQVKDADVVQELAWKNGDFIFRGETLESALRQISRWYDLDVQCPPHLGRLRFNGMISRSQPLSMIVETIQLTKLVKITLKERRLIVTD